MSSTIIKENIIELSIQQLIVEATKNKPRVTGGCLILVSAKLGLSLILMALKLSKKSLTDANKSQVLNGIINLKAIQGKLSTAAENDLKVFDSFRSLPAEFKKQKNNLYYQELNKAVITLLDAAKLMNLCLSITHSHIHFCNRKLLSDMGAGAFILYAALKGILLLAEGNINALPECEIEQYRKLKYREELYGEEKVLEIQQVIEDNPGKIKT